jgi:hypothetical protein
MDSDAAHESSPNDGKSAPFNHPSLRGLKLNAMTEEHRKRASLLQSSEYDVDTAAFVLVEHQRKPIRIVVIRPRKPYGACIGRVALDRHIHHDNIIRLEGIPDNESMSFFLCITVSFRKLNPSY